MFKNAKLRHIATMSTLPKSFIEKYIESCNKGSVITDIMVEYDKEPTFDGNVDKYAELKVAKDNTITIKRIKDSWSKEEIILLFNRWNNKISVLNNYSDSMKIELNDLFNKWANDNL